MKAKYIKDNKEILAQWDFDKNEHLPIDTIIYGNNEIAWWRCEKGHSYALTVRIKVHKNSQCPFCNGRKIIVGENDLSTTMPELAAQISEKSILQGHEVNKVSSKTLLWKCELGHEFQAIVRNRMRGDGCPFCSVNKFLSGFNDLETKFPKLAKDFDEIKNNVKVSELYPSVNKYFWWNCNKGHSYYAQMGARINGSACFYCNNQKVLPGYNDLQTLYPKIANELVNEKNENKLSEIHPGSNQYFWWKCSLGHTWKTQVQTRTGGKNCPYCSNQKTIQGFNNFAFVYPSLLEEWNYGKNTVNPNIINKGYDKAVYWICKDKHEWKAWIKDRAKKSSGCPYCYGRYAIKGVTDLKTKMPHLAKEWNYEKNDKNPDEYTAFSSQKVWWKCNKAGHEWESTLNNRSKGNGCPKCSHIVSKLETEVYDYILSIDGMSYEDIIQNSRQIIKPYELDMYIPKLNKAIEFNGSYWHSDAMIVKRSRGKFKNADDFHIMKIDKCKEQGISLLYITDKDWINNKDTIKMRIRTFLKGGLGWCFTDGISNF